MPGMRKRDVTALLVSDIHLSHRPPVARSKDDWYEAMRRPLEQLRALKDEYNVPIICAGDIFHHYQQPPELVNFAIQELPPMHAIPGQHDLPFHDYRSIEQSAYWTLVEAGIVDNLKPVPDHNNLSDWGMDLMVDAFPWGQKLRKAHSINGDWLRIAVVHKYIWKTKKHPQASEEDHVDAASKTLKGYDVAVFGDNHHPFAANSSKPCPDAWNCGCLIRRKIDEIDIQPRVGLLLQNGGVVKHELDCSEDVFIEREEIQNAVDFADFSEFVDDLRNLGDESLDFKECVVRYLDHNKIKGHLRRLVLELVED